MPLMTLEAEQHLVAAAQSGNMMAFEKLYFETKDFVLRMAGFMSRGHDAEDIAQDTYVRALRSISGFRRECRFSTWLYRILCNEVGRVRRKSRVHLDFESASDELSQTPEALEGKIDLRRRLAAFEDRDRFLVYRDIEGYSDREIANEMGISIAALKSKKYRIRRTLQAALSQSPG